MRNLLLFSALCLGLSAAGRADTTFYLINNTFEAGATASGTINIDTVAGLVDSMNITVNKDGTDYLFIGAPAGQSSFAFDTQTFEYGNDNAGNILLLDFPLPSLIGYAGGDLCTLSKLCGDGQGGVFAGYFGFSDGVTDFAAITGSLSNVAPTPEPSSVLLLGTGLLASVGMIRRRVLSRSI